jgi:hypothetical protein
MRRRTMSPRMTRIAALVYAIVAGYDWHGYATTEELWFLVTGTLFTLGTLGCIAVLIMRGRRRAETQDRPTSLSDLSDAARARPAA